MSAPDTNTETEIQRHKPALSVLRGVIGYAALLFLLMVIWLVANGEEPRNPEVQIDGRTGEEVQVE